MDININDYNVVIFFLKTFLEILSSAFNLSSLIPQIGAQLFDGGVSNIVAAALETKGLVDQGKILQNLTTLNEIAGLFYLFAVIMAVGSVAVFGSYRQGLYFLLGPSLYFFMVTQTTTTNGVKAKLGNYEIPNSVSRQSAFLDQIRAIDEGGVTSAEVSLFFAAFDGITSQVIQEISALLLDTDNKQHLKITARENVLNYLLLAQPVSGVFSQIVARHHGECSTLVQEYFAAGKDSKNEVYSRKRDQGDVEQGKTTADRDWGTKTVIFGEGDKEIRSFLMKREGTEGFPKLGVTENDPIIFTCKSLWTVIMATLKQVAKQSLEPQYFEGTNEQPDDGGKTEAYEDTRETLEEPFNGSSAEEVLVVHHYRNYLNKSTHSALNGQVFSNSPFNAKEFQVAFQEIPGAEARGAFFGIRYFATSLPYIQGMLLYLLSIAFPFFAILLVIPGKATSFIMWCSLWVWVKSWDLGFAVVLVVKDLYWEMLKHTQNTFDNKIDLEDPFSVFSVAMNSDPLANMRTYWEVTYALTIGIPFLTAHFCLGATDFFDMFKSSIDQTVGRFRQVETAAGRRSIGNLIQASQSEQMQRVGMTAAKNAAAQHPKGTGGGSLGGKYLPYGAQTSHGKSVGYSDAERGPSMINMSHRVANARQAMGMINHKVATALTQVGNRKITNQLQSELDKVYDMETRSANALGGRESKGEYVLPNSFKGLEDLDNVVSKEMLDTAVAEFERGLEEGKTPQEKSELLKLQFDQSKTYTLEEFMLQEAAQKGQIVMIPHVMRGMVDLDSKVSQKDLEYMFPNADSTLRRAAAKGEDIQWKDVFNETYEEQRTHHAYLAATVGRRHLPDTEGASMNFLQAIRMGEAVAIAGRSGIAGDKGLSDQYAVPGMEHLVEKLFEGDLIGDLDSPGLDSGQKAATGSNIPGGPKSE